ncbi:MAG: alpha-galactosidase [Fimbriimonas sp.]|nr:alpha-galactosidase [Fimbriimonas sp.]
MSLQQIVRIQTKRVALEFEVDAKSRLVQRAFGGQENDPSTVIAIPASGDGWVFEPALRAVHADGNTSTDLIVDAMSQQSDLTRIDLRDPEYPLFVQLFIRAIFDLDTFEIWTVIHHEEESEVVLEAFASSSLDFGTGEFWLTQFSGDWADEANMISERLSPGTKSLDSKLGVRAHQFTAPWFLVSQGAAPSEDEGVVFGGSLAWAGSFRFSFEVLPNRRLRTVCGMNPNASAYRLAPGVSFETPKMVWACSDRGTGDLSRLLHRYVREEVLRDGDRPRSILLNNWEATYFTFDEDKIVSLFAEAKELGIELFLLDDGWFGSKYPRNDDSQGLGDWKPDLAKLPHGLSALTDEAERLGLQFGIWFEPEMVNPRSELFEKHPDWLIRQPKREMELQRNQMVLDLTNPEVCAYAYGILDQTLRANPGITYVKWDCNRYFTQPGSSYLRPEHQSHLQIEYVRGLYEVMGRLALEHPGVQVMMCSGGGGRVDYGSMRFAHELWPSDMTDPARRIFIQWGFSHFFPALAMANHVTRSGERSLKFAFDVAMSGRMGLDIDLANLSVCERQFAARAIAAYRQIREIVQFGGLFRLESPYGGPRSSLMYCYGAAAVVFAYALEDSRANSLALKGLDRERLYQAKEINGECGMEGTLSGAHLCEHGLPMRALGRFESAVILLTAQ